MPFVALAGRGQQQQQRRRRHHELLPESAAHSVAGGSGGGGPQQPDRHDRRGLAALAVGQLAAALPFSRRPITAEWRRQSRRLLFAGWGGGWQLPGQPD